MFISLSKALGKVSGLRIGAGLRITSKNAWWMCLLIAVVYFFKFLLYLLVLGGWLLYILGWLSVKAIKWLYSKIKKTCDEKAGGDSGKKPLAITSALVAGVVAVGGIIGGITSANKPLSSDETTTENTFAESTQFEEIIDLFEDEASTQESTVEEASTEETTTEEPTTEKVTTTKKETTTAKQTTAKKPTTTKAPETQAPQSNSKTVYRTPSGKRYHFDPNCGGKSSYTVSLDDAKSAGLTACKKCADG